MRQPLRPSQVHTICQFWEPSWEHPLSQVLSKCPADPCASFFIFWSPLPTPIRSLGTRSSPSCHFWLCGCPWDKQIPSQVSVIDLHVYASNLLFLSSSICLLTAISSTLIPTLISEEFDGAWKLFDYREEIKGREVSETIMQLDLSQWLKNGMLQLLLGSWWQNHIFKIIFLT